MPWVTGITETRYGPLVAYCLWILLTTMGYAWGFDGDEEGPFPLVAPECKDGVPGYAAASVAVGMQCEGGFQNAFAGRIVASMDGDLNNNDAADPRAIHAVSGARGNNPAREGCGQAYEACKLDYLVGGDFSVGDGVLLDSEGHGPRSRVAKENMVAGSVWGERESKDEVGCNYVSTGGEFGSA